MKDKEFGSRLKRLRKDAGLKQTKAAPMIGVAYSTLQNNEAGQKPNQNNLQKYIIFYGCCKDWLLTGIEPVYQKDDESTEAVGISRDKKKVEYNADMDDFGKAVSGLKEIFDSGDPILIPVAQAGIHAFQISVRREAQNHEQAKEINHLKKECDDLKERLSSLERHLAELDRRKQDRRQEDHGPPDEAERRSGSERRKYAAMG